jgi:DNA-binding IclR family transcriptional regulator
MTIVHSSTKPFDLDDVEEQNQRGGIQSLVRAFAILEEVARSRDGISLADLSKKVGLHNSTTFHLAKTMATLGYIRQSRDTKRYRVGRSLFALAAGAFDEAEMVGLATPVLESLSQASGECAHLAVRMGDRAVILTRTPSPGAFQMSERAGVVRPAYCTALGKVLLAALRPDQFEDYLERVDLVRMAKNTIVDPDRLRIDIEEARGRGVAYDDCEFDEEVRCVAAAVHGFSGRVVAAIGISGPIWRLSIQTVQDKGKIVREAAAALSAIYGGSPPTEVVSPLPTPEGAMVR